MISEREKRYDPHHKHYKQDENFGLLMSKIGSEFFLEMQTPLTDNHFAKKPLADRGGTPPP